MKKSKSAELPLLKFFLDDDVLMEHFYEEMHEQKWVFLIQTGLLWAQSDHWIPTLQLFFLCFFIFSIYKIVKHCNL